MNKMYIGKFINTHGIKGEIKILSDIDHKDLIFLPGNTLIIDNKSFVISSYRVHKNLDMVTFDSINDINDILPYKGKNVFIDRDLLDKTTIFYNDLIDKKLILNDIVIGKVLDYDNGINPLLICLINDKKVYIPLKGNFIKEVNDDNIILEEIAKGIIL